MGIINNFFGMILNGIFEGVSAVVPTYTLGITIIIFTLVAQLLLTPLKLKQQRTTRAMGRIQPELQKLQKKYKNKSDQQTQAAYSAEMQALYKKHKISPLSGCLPMLIQFPLIIALYNVLRQPSMHIAKLGAIYSNVADTIINKVANYQGLLSDTIYKVSQGGAVQYDLTSAVKTSDGLGFSQFLSQLNTQQWQEFLSKVPTDIQNSLTSLLQQKHSYELFVGVNLVDSPSQLFKSGVWLAIIIPIVAGASTFIFSKITMAASNAMQQNGEGAGQTETMMKMMNIMMPIMTGMFSWSVPSGLALYWISGNIIMMAQQVWVNKMAEKQELKYKLKEEQNNKTNTVVKKKTVSPQNGEGRPAPKKRPVGEQNGEGRPAPKKRPVGEQNGEGRPAPKKRPVGEQNGEGRPAPKKRPVGEQSGEGKPAPKKRPAETAQVNISQSESQSQSNKQD
ncbi:MAG: membrane protein insertase YidC [Cellulosilyticaceae bacterium]